MLSGSEQNLINMLESNDVGNVVFGMALINNIKNEHLIEKLLAGGKWRDSKVTSKSYFPTDEFIYNNTEICILLNKY